MTATRWLARALAPALLVAATSAAPPAVRELADPAAVHDAQGSELMRYLVSCALPAGVVVRHPQPRAGQPATFHGRMGLAPGWMSGALTPREQRLLTACLLARSNALGVPVQISMRSPRADAEPALRASDEERRSHGRLEGAFFGNLFGPVPRAYVCTGGAAPDRARWLQTHARLCTLPGAQPGLTRCGFVDTGACAPPAYRQDGVEHAGERIEVWLPR